MLESKGTKVSDFDSLFDKLNKPLKYQFSVFDKRLLSSIVILLIFNILDGLLSLWGLQLQLIEEVNPLMQQLMMAKPIALMIVKILLPILLGAALWQIRNTSRKLVSYGLGLVLTCYSGVMILHGYWVIQVLLTL